jgi:type VI secretion system protein ImpF
MAELTPQERLQPSLLDRLTDDAPTEKRESREKRILSMRQLRASVLRDLGWLLNSRSLGSEDDLEDYPEVGRSVVNYGMPDLAGSTVSSVDPHRLERLVRQVIWDYEPRILKDSVRVRLVVDDRQMNQNAVVFEIDAELWAQPVPLHLYMKTEVDLETGHVSVSESSGGGGR